MTAETIASKAEELEMSKEELDNEIYKILFDTLNVDEEEISDEVSDNEENVEEEYSEETEDKTEY